jgi:hypothetical protein
MAKTFNIFYARCCTLLSYSTAKPLRLIVLRLDVRLRQRGLVSIQNKGFHYGPLARFGAQRRQTPLFLTECWEEL